MVCRGSLFSVDRGTECWVMVEKGKKQKMQSLTKANGKAFQP